MTAQSQEAGMSDLIRRIDAMQACQVAPSDEWSKATKGGYNQAATDCAMALLKCEPVPPTLSAAMQLPEVRAMVSQLEAWLEVAKHCSITEGVCCCGDDMKGHADPMDCGHTSTDHGTYHAHMLVKSTQSALAAIKEPKL